MENYKTRFSMFCEINVNVCIALGNLFFGFSASGGEKYYIVFEWKLTLTILYYHWNINKTYDPKQVDLNSDWP